MMEIRYAPKALVVLRKSHKKKLLRQKIKLLAHERLSLANNITKLQGRADYRLRVQDWRIIFRIEKDILWIDEVGPRGSIYEGQ